MITEKAIQDFVIYCTSGASKPQIMRHMKEYYDCGEDEVKELMKIHNSFLQENPYCHDNHCIPMAMLIDQEGMGHH